MPGTPLLPCPAPRRRSLSGRRPRTELAARAALAAIVLAVTACGAAKVRPAPFRARPDSVDAGSLLGPFDGKVVDAGTGEPVTGALVYATWTFQSGTALQSPSGYREAVTSTDGGGRYRLDRLRGLPGGGRVADFNLVIYKRGYVAYRSDRRFDDLGPRLDFAQRQNQVRLEKWRSDYSHVRHLRFVGGGPAIAALTRWEMPEAAAELAGVKAGPRVAADLVVGGGALAASQVLTEQDIRSITKFDGTFETGPLNDEPDTDLYSSQHFRALGQPETFDVALRVWKLDGKTAEDRYAELLTSLPKVKEVNEIADRSMRATESQIFGVGFLDSKRGVVVLITCGQSQCKTADVLVALGRKAHENIRRQVAERSVEEGDAAPSAPAPTTPGQPVPGATPGGLRPTPRARPATGPLPVPPASAPTTPSPLSPTGQPSEPKPAPGSQDATP